MKKGNIGIILKSAAENLIIANTPLSGVYNTYTQAKAERNMNEFKRNIENRILKLENELIYKTDIEINQAIEYVVFEQVVNVNVIQRIPCYIEGLKNYLLSSCTFDELEQYYINLNELLLSDIDDLVGLFNDAEYKLSDDVRDKLLSRGLIKNDLDTKTEENLDELLGNIRNSLNNSYKSGWEDMWRDSIEVSYEVSKWGSKFLAFFSKIDLALDEEIK